MKPGSSVIYSGPFSKSPSNLTCIVGFRLSDKLYNLDTQWVRYDYFYFPVISARASAFSSFIKHSLLH